MRFLQLYNPKNDSIHITEETLPLPIPAKSKIF